MSYRNEQPTENTKPRLMEVSGTVTFTRHVEASCVEDAEALFLEAVKDDHGEEVSIGIDMHSIEVA